MSAYNESDKGEWVYKHVYTLIKEIAKGPDSYRKYSEEETEEILGLPDIEGTGNQYSLHQAMLRDTTGTLQSLKKGRCVINEHIVTV